jgi:adenine-specific DNA methylase
VDLVVTDPPYFDNVHYSELADFFYCWLAMELAGKDTAFHPSSTRKSGEVQDADVDAFADGLARVFRECARVMKPAGTLAFTFHHSRPEAWVAVARALISAGLAVVATHPVKAEMSVAVPKQQAKEPIDLDLIVVCQHADTKRPPTVAVCNAADQLARLRATGMKLSRGDVRVVVMGELLREASDSRDVETFESLFSAGSALVEAFHEEPRPAGDRGSVGPPAQLSLFT